MTATRYDRIRANETAVETFLIIEKCFRCGTVFAMDEVLYNTALRDGPQHTFYCPNGHGQVYKESEADKIRRKLDEKTKELARETRNKEMIESQLAESRRDVTIAENRRRAAKGQLTKLRNSVAQGKCPVCAGIFPQLRDHMAADHPEFEQEQPEDA